MSAALRPFDLCAAEQRVTGRCSLSRPPRPTSAVEILAVGIVATLTTDAWQRLLQTIVGIPPANWALVGRWVAWMSRGEFVHRPITATPKVNGELAIGWASHPAVGV